MKHLLLSAVLLCLLGLPAAVTGQTQTDELRAQLAGSEGIERIQILATLVDALRTTNARAAIEYGNEGLALLADSPNAELEADILNEMAWAHRVLGNYADALAFARRGLAAADSANYPRGIGRAYNSIGSIYFNLGDNELALENWLTTLDQYERAEFSGGVAGALNNIGLVYTRQGDFDDATKQFFRALEISKANGNEVFQSIHLDNLGEAYVAMGRYDDAERYYLDALALTQQPERAESRASITINIGNMYLQKGDFAAAQRYLEDGWQQATSLGGRAKQAESSFYMARLHQQLGEPAKAIEAGQLAYDIASDIGAKHLLRDINGVLAALYEQIGNFEAALKHSKAFSGLQVDLFDSERQNKLAALQTRFEVTETEKELAMLQKEQAEQALQLEAAKRGQRNTLFGILLLSVASVAVFTYMRVNYLRQRQLSRLAANYDQLLNSFSLGVIAADADGDIRFANNAIKELTGGDAGATQRLTQHAATMITEARKLDEWQLQIADQAPKSLLLGVERRLDTSGQPNGLWLIATDLTERKNTNAKLMQAAKLATLGEMSTGMAHELNQPLNVISLAGMNLRMMFRRGTPEKEAVLAKLEKIDGAVRRASSLIDHMRAYGRVSNEAFSTIDIGEVAARACELRAEPLARAGVTLENNIPSQSTLVRGNALQLEQVLINLINNGKDAILDKRTSGTVRLDAQQSDKTVLLSVTDNGGGIPEHVLPHVFEPFFTTKPVGEGTGLGGSISYGIVKDMQGDIWAENLDDGARIAIQLPVTADPIA